MKRLLHFLGVNVVKGVVKGVSCLPFPVIYVLSDGVAFLMHSVVKYRRKVVRDNLLSSFPEKNAKEIEEITKGYYRFLSDYFFETVKMASFSPAKMRRHLTVEGIEPLNESVRRGQSVSLFLGHYCNWEWVSSLPLHIDSSAICGQIYHPLESPVMDDVFLWLRSRFGARSIPMADTLQTISKWYRKGQPSVIGYISDQVPGYGSIHRWVDFLRHDTPVYSGAEKISRILHADCYYVHLSRPKRGYYHLKFLRMSPEASREEKFYLTDRFFSELESQIRDTPQYWLWSHRRWKRTREKFVALYGVEEAAKRLTRL